MRKTISIFICLLLFTLSSAQEMQYDIRSNYSRTISKDQLLKAVDLSDINPGYPASWISQYVEVEITTSEDGIEKKAVSPNDQLSLEQLNHLKVADMGTDIRFHISYYNGPESKNIEVKEINFSYTLVPDVEASFPGGYDLMRQYLKEHAIDEIFKLTNDELELATVQFKVLENGEVANVRISQTSHNQEVDELLLRVIRNMPIWKPAQNADGSFIRQVFEFSVGNFIGC